MAPRARRLPALVQPFFWDCDFSSISLLEHRGFIVRRLLSAGSPDAIEWLRRQIGDGGIRKEIVNVKARGLGHAQVARWIPIGTYARWAAERPPRLWDAR